MLNSVFRILIPALIILRPAEGTKLLLDGPGFDHPASWMSGYLPCSLEEVVFPETYSAVLPLPKKVAVSGLVLPREGALLLEQDATITLGEDHHDEERECENGRSRKAYLKPAIIRKWFSPRNWLTEMPPNAALPHLERVPCSNEAVVIQRRGALAIDLENVPVLRLGQLGLAGSLISRDFLSYLFKTDVGQLLFKNAASTRVEYYHDDTCGCHQESWALLEPICHNVVASCQRPHCLVPITPYESCCPICGSSLQFTVESCDAGNLEKLRKVISDAIHAEDLMEQLDFHVNYVNPTPDRKVLQAIIVDRHAYREKSVEFVQHLNSSTNWTKLLSGATPKRLEMQFSGRPYNPNITFGSVVLIILCLMFVGMVSLVIFAHYAPNNRYLHRIPQWIHDPRLWRDFVLRSPFVFARFDNMGGTVGGAVETDMQESIIMGYDAESEEVRERAFDNPMFVEKESQPARGAKAGHDTTTPRPLLGQVEVVGKALGKVDGIDQYEMDEDQELTEIKLESSSSDEERKEDDDNGNMDGNGLVLGNIKFPQ